MVSIKGQTPPTHVAEAEVLALIQDCYAGNLNPEDRELAAIRQAHFCQGAGSNAELVGGANIFPIGDGEDTGFLSSVAFVYRITAAQNSGEERPVFFVCIGQGEGTGMDVVGMAGPYTNLADLAVYVCRQEGTPDEWWVDKPFPEASQMKALPA